jgi:trigger factor
MTDEELAVEKEADAEGDQEELTEDQKLMAELKEAVSVKKEDLGGLRLKLTVTVPRDMIEGRMSKEFAELKREAAIPGFRKGHAPLKLVEKRFATDVGQQLKSQLLGSGYLAAVEKEEIKPLGDPLIWCKVKEEHIGEDGRPRNVEVDKLLPIDRALDHMNLAKDGPLTFSCEMEIKPEFAIPELTKIPVVRPKLAIAENDIDEAVIRLRYRDATFEPVEKGGVELNDMLYVDLKATVGGELLASEQNIDIAARPMRLHGIPLPELADALAKKKVGDEVVCDAPVPEDHEKADLRGKKARFEFTIREIKRLSTPPVDAEFLSNAGFETETDFRGAIREQLEARLERSIKEQMLEQVGNHLIENTELEIPAGLSQRQTDRSVAKRMIDLMQRGVPAVEIERIADEMRTKAHDQTIRDLKLFFVLEKVAADREIDVNEEELNAAISGIARQSGKRFDRVRDELSKGDGLSMLYLQLRDEKVLEEILADAEVMEGEARKASGSGESAKEKGPKKRATTAKSVVVKEEAPKAVAKKTDSKKPAKKAPTEKPEKSEGKSSAKKK